MFIRRTLCFIGYTELFSLGEQHKCWELIHLVDAGPIHSYIVRLVWCSSASRVRYDVEVIIPICHVLRSHWHHVLRPVLQITLYAMYSRVSLNQGLSVTQRAAVALTQVQKRWPVDFPGDLSVTSAHNHTSIQGCPLWHRIIMELANSYCIHTRWLFPRNVSN